MWAKTSDVLLQTALVAGSREGLRSALDTILDQLGQVVDYDSACIMLLSGSSYRVIAGRGFPPDCNVRELIFPADRDDLTLMRDSRQPIVIDDVRLHPAWMPHPCSEHVRAWIGAPLQVRDTMIGILNLDKAEPGYYTAADAHMVLAFANQAAVVIENARLLEAERERSAQLRLVADISHRVLSILDPEALLDYAVKAIQAQFSYYYVDVFLVEPDTGYLIFQTSSHDEVTRHWREKGLRFRIGQEGITGWVAASGQAYRADDVLQDPRYIPDTLLLDTRSELTVPIRVADRILGVLDLNSDRPNAFDDQDLFVTQNLADQLALALENARLFSAEARRRREAETLQASTQALRTTLDLHEVLELILRELRQVVPYDSASVQQLQGNTLEIIGGDGFPNLKELLAQSFDMVEGSNPNRQVIHSRTPVIVDDAPSIYHAFDEEPHARAGTRSWLGVPLLFGDRVIGMISLDKREPSFYHPEHARLATAFAAHAAIAIENARLFTAERNSHLELKSIQATAALLSAELHIDTLLERMADEAAQAFRSEATSVMLWDANEDSLVVAASHGLSDDYSRRQRITKATVNAVTHGGTFDPIYIPNLYTAPFGDPTLVAQEGIQSLLTISLSVKGRLLGVLNIYSKGHARTFSPAEIELAETFAAHASVAIENARLYQAAERQVAELEAVRQAALGLTSSLQLQEVLESILACSVRLLRSAQDAHIYLYGDGHLTFGAALRADGRRNQEWAEPRPQGLTYTVAREGRPIVVPDIQAHPLYAGAPPTWTGAIVGLPLTIGQRVVGVMNISYAQPRTVPESELRVLQLLADQAAVAIENARLYQELEQRLRELSLLFEISTALSTSLDESKVLTTTAQQIATVLGADGCCIARWDRDLAAMVILLDHSGDPQRWPAQKPGTVYSLSDYPALGWALAQRQPRAVQIGDPEADPAERAWMNTVNARSMLVVPMISGDTVIGTLELAYKAKERRFTPTEISLCQTLANQAAAALENARLFQAEREQRTLAEALHAATAALVGTLDLERVLDRILEQVNHVIPSDAVNVMLIQGAEVRTVRRRGYDRFGVQEQLDELVLQLADVPSFHSMQETNKPVVIPDTAEHPGWQRLPETEWLRSYAGAPICVRDRVIGFLSVDSSIPNFFKQADAERLQAFANQAAIAIRNADLYQELSHHLEEVMLLNKVALAATGTLDFDDVVRRSMAALLDMPQFERANVLLVDQSTGHLLLHPALARSQPASRQPTMRIPPGVGICGRVVTTGVPLRTNDTRQEPAYIAGYSDSLSELAVPLRVGDRIIGVLDTQSTHLNAYTEEDERLLVTLAGQLSTLIDNARLFKETQQRLRELTALSQVSQALTEARDLRTILSIVLDEAFALLGSQEGSILLVFPRGGNRLRMVAERGLGTAVQEAFNNRPVLVSEGTYRRTLAEGRMVEVADTSQDTDFLQDVGSRARSVTNVPLITEHRAIGLIAVDGLPQDDVTRRLLMALADMAAVAIDKERLHQETADRLAEVSTLFTLATQITGSLSLSRVLESVVTILKMTLDCRACCIFLLDPLLQSLQLEASSGLPDGRQAAARVAARDDIGARVIGERRPIYAANISAMPDLGYFDPDARSVLMVPLIVRNQVIGVLSLDDTKPNAFDEEVRLLTIAAAQAAVAIENAQLYESLQASFSDLEEAYDSLRELDRMKSELVQNISHELRTPLTFIKGYVELLQDGDMGELTADQKMALDIVASKAQTLSHLVDDIITLQHATRERVRLVSMSLADVGHAAVRAARASAAELQIALQDDIQDDLPFVQGDEQRLGQVLDNLLSNALKFSPAGATITVRMYLVDGSICTEVEDQGIGIPADKLLHVFDRFYQVDGSTTRRFGGTGLGLAIVKQIVEAHGGHVGVRSEQNKGSCFYFTIPVTGSFDLSS